MIDAAEGAGWDVLGLTPRGEVTIGEAVRTPLAQAGKAGRLLLLGTEGEGLADDVLARVRRVKIDMTATMDSLNVAVASGIALFEATRPPTTPTGDAR